MKLDETRDGLSQLCARNLFDIAILSSQGINMTTKWRTLKERIVVKDRWIDLRAEKCETPSGALLDPFYTLHLPDLVFVVALTSNEEVVLVREYRHGIKETVLNLPGGAIEPGESPIAAAKRELAEEAGFTATRWHQVAKVAADVGRQNNNIYIFIATGASCDAIRNLDTGEEGMTMELLQIKGLYKGLSDGILPHAGHISAFLLAMSSIGRLELK
ncbi:hypothetical protein CCR94_07760 [Rhodoblastus sphagnicola]|uniref:Nudix hydrolase domain-containing protein n=3 Tax=Rhodoblastus sphagnicola TaxID=333368 RepID=A0A2S6NBC5_9HYPH|nr:hypothetical protein CCR94_07760 [Rhodoblastus sphagnicola]